MEVEQHHPHLLEALEADEEIRARADATDAVLAITDRRVVVAAPKRVALAVAIEGVRRVQFDIERSRPATLVIVPDDPNHEAQVLTIAPHQYEAAGRALVTLGLELARITGRRRTSP